MQNFIVSLLSCSVTMSVLALLFMASTPFLAKRYSERGRYYAGLVFVIALIVPFRPQPNSAIINIDILSDTTAPIVQIGNGTPSAIPIASSLVVKRI